MRDDETSNQDSAYDYITSIILPLLAVAAFVAAIWRMFAVDEKTLSRLDSTTLLYLGVAGALLLLRDVKTLAFGDYKVEFDRVRKIAKEAENKAENAQSVALGVGRRDGVETRENIAANVITPGDAVGDPWKGRFGGESENNNRRLEAQVSRIAGSFDLFSIKLAVFSTLPRQAPLRGAVQFFLHPTFNNDRPIIMVGPNGIAELKLTAWGAFTVGAIADDGRTNLELDLSELDNAPAEFRNR